MKKEIIERDIIFPFFKAKSARHKENIARNFTFFKLLDIFLTNINLANRELRPRIQTNESFM
jgi:hypothetical protein